MNYQESVYDRKARAEVKKLKETYVIDMITAERLEEIFVYLYLSQVSKNQRGVELHTENLKRVLHNCAKITIPVTTAQRAKSGCRI